MLWSLLQETELYYDQVSSSYNKLYVSRVSYG